MPGISKDKIFDRDEFERSVRLRLVDEHRWLTEIRMRAGAVNPTTARRRRLWRQAEHITADIMQSHRAQRGGLAQHFGRHAPADTASDRHNMATLMRASRGNSASPGPELHMSGLGGNRTLANGRSVRRATRRPRRDTYLEQPPARTREQPQRRARLGPPPPLGSKMFPSAPT